MLSHATRPGNRIPLRSVMLAVFLLAGVLSMAYGLYQSSYLMLYIGLAITFLGSVIGIAFTVILPLVSGKTSIPPTE